MKKKIYLLPLSLLAIFLAFNWSCETEDENDELCEAFDGLPEYCEIPTICCPTDGGDCYYVNPDGENYYCDSDLATDTDPDGCAQAENAYIDDHCDTTAVTKSIRAEMHKDLSQFTRKLMQKAREQSVCYTN
ncbi:MAG TPA: hypothetical protein VJ937_15560 [Salinivirga sp.]|uniref:hypothetical protein n=1 Tax=Salinivirga sp. TaxID=1970192 RepID=UPI002B4A2B90|nr:hypothetical protein [Salinivirga sp.]HKK60897.1 hypothetical protein [Salinivirga sp.]